MKVWIINPYEDLPKAGEKGMRYASLADSLRAQGHEVTWWTTDWSHIRKERRTPVGNWPGGMDVVQLPVPAYRKNVSLRRIWNHFQYARAFARAAPEYVERKGKPDVIAFSMPPMEIGWQVLRLAHRWEARVVMDVMDAWPDALLMAAPKWGLARGLFRCLLLPYECLFRHYCHSVDAVSAQSEAFAHYAKEHGFEGPVSLFRLGAYELTRTRHEGTQNAAGLRLLYLGSMGLIYRLERVLRAVARLREEGIDLHLDFVGDGDSRPELEALAESLGIQDSVSFHGYLTGTDLEAALARAQVGLIPMSTESRVAIPYKAASYLSAGLAVVNTLPGELEATLKKYDCGLNYEEDSVDSLADRLRLLSRQPDRLQRMRAGARRCFEAAFKSEVVYPKMAGWLTASATRARRVDFWTSTEYTGFLVGLIRELENCGLQARQRFFLSEQSYRSAKGTAGRLWLRVNQYIGYPVWFCLKLAWGRLTGRTRDDDVLVVSTNTFYVPLIATCFSRRVVHLVYDLFPEAMIHAGKWKEGSFKVRIARWVTRATLKRAQLNVFLGDRLEDYVTSTYPDCGRTAVIPVGADQALFGKAPQPTERIRILYCGNFGNMHDADTLFDFWHRAAREIKPGAVAPLQVFAEVGADGGWTLPSFAFVCSGPKRPQLESTIQALPPELRDSITLKSGLSQQNWIDLMEDSQLALVTMARGAETVVMPSKAYSAMMAGQAILAIAPEESDLVDLVKASQGGWWVSPGDVTGLTDTLQEIAKSPHELHHRRQKAFNYAHANLGQDSLAKQWSAAL